MVRCFVVLLMSMSSLAALAQDEDYYSPEKPRPPISQADLDHIHRWGPKLGIEAMASVGYAHMYTPATIQGGFERAAGGLGYDVGIGARIRIYHKLAVAFGFQFSGRGYSMSLTAFSEVDTGSGTAVVDVDVSEKMNMQYIGFYIKPVIELSRKFHLAVLFRPSWELVNQRRGTSTQAIVGGPANLVGSIGILENQSSFETIPNQFELGFEFAYKWVIAPQLILKPHVGINFATSGIFRTGAEIPTPFGGWEQNPSFMTLRVGVIFETGLWMDQLNDRR